MARCKAQGWFAFILCSFSPWESFWSHSATWVLWSLRGSCSSKSGRRQCILTFTGPWWQLRGQGLSNSTLGEGMTPWARSMRNHILSRSLWGSCLTLTFLPSATLLRSLWAAMPPAATCSSRSKGWGFSGVSGLQSGLRKAGSSGWSLLCPNWWLRQMQSLRLPNSAMTSLSPRKQKKIEQASKAEKRLSKLNHSLPKASL